MKIKNFTETQKRDGETLANGFIKKFGDTMDGKRHEALVRNFVLYVEEIEKEKQISQYDQGTLQWSVRILESTYTTTSTFMFG